jgi:hypothetical protein
MSWGRRSGEAGRDAATRDRAGQRAAAGRGRSRLWLFPQVSDGRGAATLVAAMNRQHRYESCRDKDCERPFCRIWREAWQQGYDDGFADGVRACQNTDAS